MTTDGTIVYEGMDQDMSKKHPDRAKLYWEGKNLTLAYNVNAENFVVENEKGTKLVITMPNIYIRQIPDSVAKWDQGVFPNINYIDDVSLGLPAGHIGKIAVSDYIGISFPPDNLINELAYYSVKLDANYDWPANGGNLIMNNNVIIGTTYIRDTIVIFTNHIPVLDAISPPPSTFGMGAIWTLDYDDDFNPTLRLKYVANLNFNAENAIKAVTYFETSNIQKVYWTDGKRNQLRLFNLAENQFHKRWPEHLDATPKTLFTQAEVTAVQNGGDLPVGVVQYYYSYYNNNEVSTKLSPGSNLYPVVYSENEGVFNDTPSRAFNVRVTPIDTRFEKIRIYRFHYSTLTATPSVNLIADEFITSGTFTVLDSGTQSVIGSLSTSEVNNLGSNFYKPNALEIVENRLVLANIEETQLDVDFDCRAYRYSRSVDFTKIYKKDGTYNIVRDTPLLGEYTPENVPKTHDCINPFNDAIDSSASNYNLQYKKNSTVLGATGPNVSIDIVSETITEDEFLDPLNYYKRGYKQGETYRIGVRFFFTTGQYSFVKWMCDLRMPETSWNDTSFHSYPSVDNGDRKLLYPKITISNLDSLPDNVIGYQIVRVERTDSDKKVIAQGFFNHTVYSAGRGNENYDDVFLPMWTQRNMSVSVLQQGYNGSYDGMDLYNPLNSASELNAGTGKYIMSGKILNYYSPEITFLDIKANKEEDYFMLIGGNRISLNRTYLYAVTFSGDANEYISDKAYKTTIYTHELNTSTNPFTLTDGGSVNEDTAGEVMTSAADVFGIEIRPRSFYQECTAGLFYNTVDTKILRIHDIISSARGSVKSEIFGSDYRNYGFYTGSANDNKTWKEKVNISSYHAKCFTLQINAAGVSNINPYSVSLLPPDSNFYVLTGDYRKEVANQYGGNTYSARQRNRYMPCGDYQSISSTSHQQVVKNGDIFIVDYVLQRMEYRAADPEYPPSNIDGATVVSQDPSGYDTLSLKEVIKIPLHTTVNLALRHTRKETEKEFEDLSGTFYGYNSVFQKENNYFTYFPKPVNLNLVNNYDTMFRNSQSKIPGENLDNFTKFLVGDYKIEGAKYGAVTALHVLKDNLYAVHENATAAWTINPKVVTSTNVGPTSLGTGEFFYDYNIIAENGSKHRFGSICSKTNLYVLDINNKKMISLQTGDMPYSDMKGGYRLLQNILPISLADDIINGKGITSGYDATHHNVYFTILSDINYTLSLNEMTGRFVSYHDYFPPIYLYDSRYLFSAAGINNGLYHTSLWVHGQGAPGYYYNQYFPWWITLLLNTEPLSNKQLWTFTYRLEATVNGVTDEAVNFDRYRVSTEIQDTGDITLNTDTRRTRKAMRKWSTQVRRNETSSNPRLQKERITNEWFFCKLTGDNLLKGGQPVDMQLYDFNYAVEITNA